MSYRTMLPDEVFHGGAVNSRGIFDLTDAAQMSVNFNTGLANRSYGGHPTRVKAPQAFLYLQYIKGTETSISVNMFVYGSDAKLQENMQVNPAVAAGLPQLPFLSGIAYTLNRSSLEDNPWQLTGVAIAANKTAAYPIHFGSAAPGVASWIPSVFCRLTITFVGTPSGTTFVHMEMGWAEVD